MQRMHPVFIMYWKPKMKTLQPGTVSRLQEKSLAAFHAAFSLFRCDQYQRNRGNQNCPGIITVSYTHLIYCLFIVVKCIFLYIETCKSAWYTFYK